MPERDKDIIHIFTEILKYLDNPEIVKAEALAGIDQIIGLTK
jgi:hypothetical protein